MIMHTPSALLLLGFSLLLMAGCSSESEAPLEPQPWLTLTTLETPAGPNSGEPNLHATVEGTVLLSWIEPQETTGHALRFSRLEDRRWSPAQTIATGSNWFVNWADFPSLVAVGDNGLAAHLLVKSADATYAYDVNILQSPDGGATWAEAITPHRDGTPTEHGFVSMVPWRQDRLLAVWLDGRNTGGGDSHGEGDGHGMPGGAMTLRAAVLDASGQLSAEALLDDRVCDCCQTSAAATTNGAVAVYRDRSEDEIRDIALVRLHDGQWSTPRIVHEDGWEIAGCPVNGPAVAAKGTALVVAWFTGAQDTPRVRVVFSDDEGETFGEPLPIDDGTPLGRVDTVLLPDGAAFVTWLEMVDGTAEVRARRVYPDGTRSASATISTSSSARSSGFPRLTQHEGTVYLSWRQPGDPPTIQTALATVSP